MVALIGLRASGPFDARIAGLKGMRQMAGTLDAHSGALGRLLPQHEVVSAPESLSRPQSRYLCHCFS